MVRNLHLLRIALLFLLALNGFGTHAQLTGNEFYLLANQFNKNQQTDSAVFYYKKASTAFIASDSVLQSINSLNEAGQLLTRAKRLKEALLVLNDALSLAGMAKKTVTLECASTLVCLGVVYYTKRDFDRALKCNLMALEIRKFLLGKFHADVANSCGAIGTVYYAQERYDSSMVYHKDALEIRDSLFGSDSPEGIPSYVSLGNIYRERKMYSKSVTCFEQALERKIKQVGSDHKDLIPYYKKLVQVCELSGNKEAVKTYQKRIRELERTD